MGFLDALIPRTHDDALQTRAKRKNECGRSTRRRYSQDARPVSRVHQIRHAKTISRVLLQSTALHLYRDDADVDFDEIMRMNDWPNLKQQVLCLTPRRFGKTTAVSMYACAFALCVPKSTQCIFSTGKRASDSLLEKVHEFAKSEGQETAANAVEKSFTSMETPRATCGKYPPTRLVVKSFEVWVVM